MTTKKVTDKNKISPATNNANDFRVVDNTGKTKERLMAEVGLSTTMLNATTTRYFNKYVIGETDLTETVGVLKEKLAKVNAGDMAGLEATLTAQTVTLDAMFSELARRAALNMGEYLSATESYMRLALKAQAQCARTVEVLANMKNPPIVYAKQMNVANGNQQVNNGNNASNTPAPTHTGKTINQPNEQLSEMNNATMDTSGTATTSGTNQAMATVEK